MSNLRRVVFSSRRTVFACIIVGLAVMSVSAQLTEFSYQGSLKSGTMAASGNHDFEFALFDAPSGGNQIGLTLTRPGVAVTDGIFSVKLDFGGVFTGAARFLEIRVRQSGGSGFTTLGPRQSVDSVPYAMTALNAQQLNGTSFSISGNGTVGGNLTVGGTLSVGTFSPSVINASSHISIGGVPIIKRGPNPDGLNTFVGEFTGPSNAGSFNSFFGAKAGESNIAGSSNSFFGYLSGFQSMGGSSNSFFGRQSGEQNTQGNNNSFFGRSAGGVNTTGSGNAFFGNSTGSNNTTGSFNTAVGSQADFVLSDLSFATAIGAFARATSSDTIVLGKTAGNYDGIARNADKVVVPGELTAGGLINSGTQFNLKGAHILSSPGANNIFLGPEAEPSKIFTGSNNTFFGWQAGSTTSTGSQNLFIGHGSGLANREGSSNTLVGSLTNVGSENLTFATAIGAGAVVSNSNSVVLGRNLDTVRIPGNLNVAGSLTGTFTVPAANLTGVVAAANGGTGISSPGAAGNFLRSTGTGWQSAPISIADFPAGSPNYIQNTTSQQASSNFNISGNGTIAGTLTAGTVSGTTVTGNVVNSATHYNVNGSRAYSISGTSNVFAGLNTGTAGSSNTLVGSSAGATSTGAGNSFLGANAGQANTLGSSNTFLGSGTGSANTTGNLNTLVGSGANVGSANLTNATAIGAGAVVTSSNMVVIGRNADAVQIPGSLTVTGNLVATLPAGSGSYVQNTTTQQASSNFNISGNGVIGGGLTVSGGASIGGALTAGSFTLPGTINGVLGQTNGGTGVTSSGPVGNFLRSNGASGWQSSPLLAADIVGGSPNYIQNSTNLQASSNFNISGTGTASVFNALTQFNLNGSRILSNTGSNNLFAGVGAGTSTTGTSNSFFGASAGSANSTGDGNTFIGASSGSTNTSGSNNTLVGSSTSVGSTNLTFASAFGSGASVTTSNTVVLGRAADTVRVPGNLNVTGTLTAPSLSVSASNLTGVVAPANGGTGLSNVGTNGNFLRSNGTAWQSAALSAADIPSGSGNYIQNGTGAQTASFNVTGSGVVGTTFNVGGALTAGSFTLPATITGVLGTSNGGTGLSAPGASGQYLRSNGTNWTTSTLQAGDIPSLAGLYIQNNTTQQAGSNFNISGTGTANIFSATTQFNIGANRILSNPGVGNLFAGVGAGNAHTNGERNTSFGASAGTATTTGDDNVFLGSNAGIANTIGNSNTIIGSGANLGANNRDFATAIGSRALVNANDTIVIGKVAGTYDAVARPADSVIMPGTLNVGGIVTIPTLGATGGTPLCRNASNQIAACPAPDAPVASLREGGEAFVQTAKYDRGTNVLLGVVREQQAQIESLQKEVDDRKAAEKAQQERLDKQQSEIDALKKLLCGQNPGAAICK